MGLSIQRRALLAWPCAAVLTDCAYLPRAPVVPMRVSALPAASNAQAPVLVVMLPGAYSLPSDFVDEGFVRALREQRYAVDVLLVDSHLGYARNGTLLERLHDDVLRPAAQRGYRRIWLVGISLGAFASLGLLMRHAELIEGIVAISPYVGRPTLLEQITAAGGAAPFGRRARVEADPEADLWIWLAQADAALRDKVFLYTGSRDRFIEGQRLLGSLLAPGRLQEVPGDHDWPAWKTSWSRWLARAPWPRMSSALLGAAQVAAGAHPPTALPAPPWHAWTNTSSASARWVVPGVGDLWGGEKASPDTDSLWTGRA